MGTRLAKLSIQEALPKIRTALENSQLRAQYQDGSTFENWEDVVTSYENGDPIGICLPLEVAKTLDCYNIDVWWSFGIAVYAAEGIIEIPEEQLIDFCHIQAYHQIWFRNANKVLGQRVFEQCLWEIEDKYLGELYDAPH